MKLIIMLLSILMLFVNLSAAGATTVSFGDTRYYWPGWSNDDYNYNYGYPYDNDTDSVGSPNFTGGTAEINPGGSLTNLTFTQWSDDPGHWTVLSPGDLFINVDADIDDAWDYVVDLTSWTTSSKIAPDPASTPAYYNLYALDLALDDTSGYILSGEDHPSPEWYGYIIRDDHPVAAAGIAFGDEGDSRYSGEVRFGGWDGESQQTEYTFDFTALAAGGLELGDQFTIAWGVNCANDIIYETLANPVPEPATMLLFGSGLIGLAGFTRRLRRRRNALL